MAMDKYKVPNWAQAQVIKAAGFVPKDVAVVHDDDRAMVILDFKPHAEFSIDKSDGRVSER